MTGFKEPSLAERQNAAANARKTALKKFRAGADDPAFAQRQANRKISAAERTTAKKARDIQKAEAKTRGAELAKQAVRDAAEKVARDLADDAARGAERKAGRDARYAARKARKR